MRGARRCYCRGNCGRWWYYLGTGRPREWCDRCLPVHTRERKRATSPNLMAPVRPAALTEAA